MKQSYSETRIHKFIREYIESENGTVNDVSEEYFTVKTPSLLSPIKYTYKAAIAHEKKIDLLVTGSPAFNGIIEECLKEGILCSVNVNSGIGVENFVKNFFKDTEFQCEHSEKISANGEEKYFCTNDPKCFHRIHNTKISNIKIGQKQPKILIQFFYSVLFNNKLKKNEEMVSIILDEGGNKTSQEILNDSSLNFADSKEKITSDFFDKINPKANELLDRIIKDKKDIFDLQLKKEIDRKLMVLETKIDDDKLQKSISKTWKFDEKEWKLKKNAELAKEKDSLDTFVTVKFMNLLVLKTDDISFEIELGNKSSIKSSFLLGIDKSIKVRCHFCDKETSESYATEDQHCLCLDCVNQSIETGKVYSNKFTLNRDHTSKEYIEKESGFKCTVCGKQNSTLFEFKCADDKSKLCYNCFDYCSKCNNIFSINNLKKTRKTNKLYCPTHITKCDSCNGLMGTDEVNVCSATGMRACSCTSFSKCSLCEQEYSTKSLKDSKCVACSSLKEEIDKKLISVIEKKDSGFKKTRRWFVGKNKLNSIVVAKGLLSDTLFVIKDNRVIHEKKLSLFNKIKGY